MTHLCLGQSSPQRGGSFVASTPATVTAIGSRSMLPAAACLQIAGLCCRNANPNTKVTIAMSRTFMGRQFIHRSAASVPRTNADTAAASTPSTTLKPHASNLARIRPNEGRRDGSSDTPPAISIVKKCRLPADMRLAIRANEKTLGCALGAPPRSVPGAANSLPR
jgi:hypothetical protein